MCRSATIYQAIDAALAERLDLAVIRQVVEAAVSQSLAGLELTQELALPRQGIPPP